MKFLIYFVLLVSVKLTLLPAATFARSELQPPDPSECARALMVRGEAWRRSKEENPIHMISAGMRLCSSDPIQTREKSALRFITPSQSSIDVYSDSEFKVIDSNTLTGSSIQLGLEIENGLFQVHTPKGGKTILQIASGTLELDEGVTYLSVKKAEFEGLIEKGSARFNGQAAAQSGLFIGFKDGKYQERKSTAPDRRDFKARFK